MQLLFTELDDSLSMFLICLFLIDPHYKFKLNTVVGLCTCPKNKTKL